MADLNLGHSIQSPDNPKAEMNSKEDEQGLTTFLSDKQEQGESFLPKSEKAKQAGQRLYWIDWLRAIAIHIVTFVHCLNTTDMAYGEKQMEQDSPFEQQRAAVYRFFVQFGMPLFFYISGVSAIYFNFEKERPFWRFFYGKVQRLIYPLVLGIFFLMMPYYYISQHWCSWASLGDGKEIEPNYFRFVIRKFGDNILLKLGPLWFLLFLWILLILNYPLIKWTWRRSHMKPFGREDKITIGQQALFLVVWDRFSWLLQDHSSNDYLKFILPCNLILGIALAAFFLIQWRFQTQKSRINPNQFNGVCLFYFTGCIFQLLFCAFIPDRKGLHMCGVTIQMCFHTMFFAQGLLIATWRDMLTADWDQFKKSIIYPVFVPVTLTVQALLLPANYSMISSVYLYPIYRDFHLNCVFIYGAWITLYSVLWMLKVQINQEFDPKVFKLTTESSLWCYISHSLFIFFFLTYFVVPYKDSFPFFLAFLLGFIFTEIMCILSYLCLMKLQDKCKRKKKQAKASTDKESTEQATSKA